MLTYRVREHNKNTPTKNNKKNEKMLNKWNKRNSEMRQNTNDTRSTHLLADVEQITAVRTKQYEVKHTRIRTEEKKERRRKQGTKTKNRTEGVGSNKSSRLCHRAEPGTLSHALPSSSYSSPQWYQVQQLPLSNPPSVNKTRKTKQGFAGCSNSGSTY